MTEVENIVLEHLRHIRGAVDSTREDIREIKGRLGILESQYAHMSNRIDRLDARIDRLDARVERIEHRLELSEV